MTSLQTTQTLYKLFHWKSGTYAFEPRDVTFDRETVSPLRCESVLMEGYRIIDEWPIVRRKITSSAMTFERVKQLDPAAARAEGRGARDGESAALGKNEWRAYELAVAGRHRGPHRRPVPAGRVRGLEGALQPGQPGRAARRPARAPSAAAEVGAYARGWQERVRRGAAGVLATVAIARGAGGAGARRHRGGASARRRCAPRRQPGGALRLALPDGAAAGGPRGVRVENGAYPDQPGRPRRDRAGAPARPPLPLDGDLRIPAPGRRVLLLPPVE